MVRLPSYFKLAVLQSVYDAVGDGAYPDLLTAIKALQKNGFVLVRDGNTIISASGNGYSTTFAIPGTYSAQELFAFWAQLRVIYADALATLSNAGTSDPSQEQIFNTMTAADEFQSITRTFDDHSTLRYATGGLR